ncbi:MAG: arylsulfatase [Hyphomonadaceae bacterium]|nr:arylsulfatase [Hyphomonadaceae bacterium]
MRRALASGVALLALAVVAPLEARAQGTSERAGPHWRHYPQRPQAPEGAPNVLLIMTDDVGFGAASAFGGPIQTPTFDGLAQGGLRYNEFHTTAMCSPTRAALLTGRNHHAVGSGAIANLARDEEGYTSVIPDSAGTIADVLRLNGYNTGFFGKNHNTPEWENSPLGPFDHWPEGFGFDYYFGFNEAWADQFHPELVENRNTVEPPKGDPTYTLDRDLSDRLIGWIRLQDTLTPDRPFFAYLAPGSPHTPHHAPRAWIERYKGRFDRGWDAMREEIFARQKRAGVIPRNAVLTPRPANLPAWSSLSPEARRVAARMMEVYAAQLAHSDYQIGRVIDALRRDGRLDNTLVIFIQGDNGADLSRINGGANEYGAFFAETPSYESLLPRIDELGGPRTFGGAPSAWGWALNAPFPWGKAYAGHLGGSRTGLVVYWPGGIERRHRGEVRAQFHHVIDIAPTIYEAARIAPPDAIDGIAQQPIEGVSMLYSFNTARAPDRRREQYFEMLGNLGFYQDGWLASTTPQRMTWDRSSASTPLPSDPRQFSWELYDLRNDFSQSRNLAGAQPGRLNAMIADFTDVAARNHVMPLENDVLKLLRPGTRPSLTDGRTSFTYYPSERRYTPAMVPSLSRSWRLSAEIEIGSAQESGPIIVQGGRFTGWGLLLSAGKPAFVIKELDRPQDLVRLDAAALRPGRHRIEVEVRRGASRRQAEISLSVDGAAAASRSVDNAGIVHNAVYVGRYGTTPLIDDAAIPDVCNCSIAAVTIDLLP